MRRSVGKIDFSAYILPVGLLAGGYFLLKNFGLFGSTPTGANNTATGAALAASTAADLQTAKNAGIVQTLNDTQLNGMASSIYQSGIQSTPDQDNIVYQIMQVNTKTDLLRLIQLFGTKPVAQSAFSLCALLNYDCSNLTLNAFARSTLDDSHLSSINSYFNYGNFGINF